MASQGITLMSDVLRHSPEGELELSPIDMLSFYTDSLLQGSPEFNEPYYDHLDGRAVFLHRFVEADGKEHAITLKKAGVPTSLGTVFEEFEVSIEPYVYPGRGKYVKRVAHWSINGNPSQQWVTTKTSRMDWRGRIHHGETVKDEVPGLVEREHDWIIEALDLVARSQPLITRESEDG